jgi:hypothetical protein
MREIGKMQISNSEFLTYGIITTSTQAALAQRHQINYKFIIE